VNVHGAGDAAEVGGDPLSDLEVPLRLRQRSRDLDVDRSRQAEVEDLANDVGRLREELAIRKSLR